MKLQIKIMFQKTTNTQLIMRIFMIILEVKINKKFWNINKIELTLYSHIKKRSLTNQKKSYRKKCPQAIWTVKEKYNQITLLSKARMKRDRKENCQIWSI